LSQIPQQIRSRVIARAGGRCEYCRIPSQGQIAWFPVDHIRPRNACGETELENLALACPRCNGHKWAFETGVDPQTGSVHTLFNPRTEEWGEHFQWAPDGSLKIHGKTPTGRATVDRLIINDAEVLTIREFLSNLGIDVFESGAPA
jgi:hypothetical protein